MELWAEAILADIKAWTVAGAAEATAGQEAYDRNPYDLRILPSISLTVNTDIVNFIFEPGIGYRVEDYGKKKEANLNIVYIGLLMERFM